MFINCFVVYFVINFLRQGTVVHYKICKCKQSWSADLHQGKERGEGDLKPKVY